MQKNKHLTQILLSATIFLGAVVGFSNLAHAQTPYQYTPLATIPIGTTGQNLTTANTPVNPADYVNNLYVFAFSIATVIAVVTGVWAGVQWMFGGDSPSKIESAKKRLEGVGWGFALLLCSYTILYIINPQLVTFNLNLGTINTANLQNNLTTQQAQMQALQTAANNAVVQSQAAQQAVTTAQQKLDAAKQAFADLPVDAMDPEYNAAKQAVTDAQNALSAAQSVAIQNAGTTAVSQITADIQSYANKGDTTAIANSQAALSVFDKKMNDEASQAAALGNNALASQIDAQRISTDSSTKQTMELTPVIANMQNINYQINPINFLNSIQQTRNDILAVNNTIAQLNAAGQTTSADALSATTKANLNQLDENSINYFGCAANKLVSGGNIITASGRILTIGCSQ